MAGRREWGEAYLRQSQADLAAALWVQAREPSVLAMLLQMVFEKAAKGILLLGKQIDVDKATSSHVAASLLVAHFKREPDLLRVLGGSPHAYRDVLPLVVELERLNPAVVKASGSGCPQLEYPWEVADTGEVCWPSRDLGIAHRLGDPNSTEAQRLTRFAEALLANAHGLTG